VAARPYLDPVVTVDGRELRLSPENRPKLVVLGSDGSRAASLDPEPLQPNRKYEIAPFLGSIHALRFYSLDLTRLP
jgi:hypothetical protein